MLDSKEVQEAIDKFRKYVIQQSRSNLSKQKKNFNKSLYNSINGVSKVNPNSISLYFEMLDYGIFVDKGVKGFNPANVSPNAKIRGQQAPNSPYRFGSGNFKGTWASYTNSLEKWVKRKGVRFRNNGKYAEGSVKAVTNVVARNIYSRGLKPSLFFTKPFEKAYDRLPDEIIEAYGIDIVNLYLEKK